jgi:hypothetical protein
MSTKGDNTARVRDWDGQPAVKCDLIDCDEHPVVHFELSTAGEWHAEVDLCEKHLSEIGESARAFAVAVGAIKPISVLDRNIRAATSEHLA